MKHKISKILPIVAIVLPAAASITMGNDGAPQVPGDAVVDLKEEVMEVLNPDSVYFTPDNDPRPVHPFFSKARACDDGHIVVRWTTDEYVPWRMASDYGYMIVRTDFSDGLRQDTLVRRLKPLSLQQMYDKFGAQDSLAGIAAQMLYGKGAESLQENTNTGNVVKDVYDEQQSRFADAMMVAEWRPDVAEALALRYTDRTAKPGHNYRYAIYPLVPSSETRVSATSVMVRNTPYKRQPFEPVITDSLMADGKILTLIWDNNPEYSAYDIERRRDGETQWKKLNKNPFMTLAVDDQPIHDFTMFSDPGVELGTYFYRIRGIDAFGEWTPWSEEYRAEVTDIEAPQPPSIQYFELHRKNSDDTDIKADIHWTKDSIEPDLAGFNIFYYHKSRGDEWHQLNSELIPADIRTYTADVTGFPSGYVTVTAVDLSGNQGASMPMEIAIADLTPPEAPTGIRSLMFPDGKVVLRWNKNRERDIAGYQVYFANDSTHSFTPRGPVVGDTIFIDSLAIVGVNQKYIYYKIKALDYAGNASPYSELHEAQRVTYTKPESCVADTIWQNDSTLFMDWRCMSAHTTKEYNLYRRLEGRNDWTLVQTIAADDAPNNIVHTWDSPNYNMSKRYFYGLETVSLIGERSEIEHQVAFWHKGPQVLDIKIELTGETDRNGRIILHWQPYGDLPIGYSYQVEMKREGEDYFREIRNLNAIVQDLNLSILREGQRAEFLVRLCWPDGRVSRPSNIYDVKLTIPRDEEN